MFKKIVAPVDGSSRSIYALGYAVKLATQNNAELMIVSVIESITAFYTAGSGAIVKEMFDITEENHKKCIKNNRKALKKNILN